jgi:phosphoketolase
MIYAHLNRVIRERDVEAMYVIGPGHGGPAIVANAYLEGTYGEVCPSVGPGESGMRALFRQFSFPGGIPSHVAPETPGSIHEGGELGYALVHAYGAAFDNPDLVVACVVGDGEAETGHENLHVRGYKEEGTTTTPFDMVMMNDLDRYHLVMDVVDRVPELRGTAAHLRQEMVDARLRARAHTREHGEDTPEVAHWTWPF